MFADDLCRCFSADGWGGQGGDLTDFMDAAKFREISGDFGFFCASLRLVGGHVKLVPAEPLQN